MTEQQPHPLDYLLYDPECKKRTRSVTIASEPTTAVVPIESQYALYVQKQKEGRLTADDASVLLSMLSARRKQLADLLKKDEDEEDPAPAPAKRQKVEDAPSGWRNFKSDPKTSSLPIAAAAAAKTTMPSKHDHYAAKANAKLGTLQDPSSCIDSLTDRQKLDLLMPFLCEICGVKPRTLLFKPCGHLACCETPSCIQRLRTEPSKLHCRTCNRSSTVCRILLPSATATSPSVSDA